MSALPRAAFFERPLYFARAPGYRDYGRAGFEGVLRNVGNEGSVWSASVSGTNGHYLNFNATWLNPSNANNRAFGFQVRCLQAFIDTLSFFYYQASL